MLRRRKPVARTPFAFGRKAKRPRPVVAKRPLVAGPAEARQRAARPGRPTGLRPEWARSGWSRIPVVGGVIELVLNFVFRGRRHKTVEKRVIGTGFSAAFRAKMRQAQRPALPEPKQGRLLRQRNTGLRESMVSQNARGRIKGVFRQPKNRAA